MNVPDDRARRKALRLELVSRRQAMDAATLAPLHAALSERLASLLNRLAPRSVGFTWPYRGEFDALPLMRRWLAADPARRAALPVVLTPARPMEFLRWRPDAPMATDHHGIPIPAGDEPVSPELLIVPLNVFDAAGYRLGYGGGYFDRTLAALDPAPTCVGVAFELARCESTHPQAHDKPMDWVVTEAGVFGGSGK